MQMYYSIKEKDISAHFGLAVHPKKKDFALHTHERYELFCFLGGKAVYKVEGNSYPLKIGDIMIMRPSESHYIDVDTSLPYTRFSAHFTQNVFADIDANGELLSPFNDRPLGKFNLYRAEDFGGSEYMTHVRALCEENDNMRLQVLANLLPLLLLIKKAFGNKKILREDETVTYKIISYIGENLSESISLDDICREFYISKPQLCRIFKAATGSGVWEYITAKRLVMAQSMIKSGMAPTKIYTECGFGDYSSFYRAYKKRFGKAPNSVGKQG